MHHARGTHIESGVKSSVHLAAHSPACSARACTTARLHTGDQAAGRGAGEHTDAPYKRQYHVVGKVYGSADQVLSAMPPLAVFPVPGENVVEPPDTRVMRVALLVSVALLP
jgi:hypothetical protein